MKKIGFVDYYLSEWHANNYPAWIEEACKTLGTEEYKVAYGWAEMDVSPKDGLTTAEWCEKFGAEKCDTLEELCEKSDVILVLAPSDPQTHLGYAKVVLPYGKRTYIDKTFAPDLATANEILALAEKHGTPLFSSSALRYATELDKCGDCRQVAVTGGGGNLPEYVIHQAEILVKKLGLGAEAIRCEQIGSLTRLTVTYGDGRLGEMTYAPSLGFTVYMYAGEGTKAVHKPISSNFFGGLMADIVRFYEEGTVSFSTEQTREVAKIREGALLAADRLGEEISLSSLKA